MKWFIFLVLCSSLVSAGSISEIMYNPEGSDDHKEYVEIVFETVINLEGWTISDSASSDILVLINGSGNTSMNLIVEDGYEAAYFSSINLNEVSVYSAGSSIGNGLNNGGDDISLMDLENNTVISLSYTNEFGNGDGYALCLNPTLACLPSPGILNVLGSLPQTNNSEENKTVIEEEKREIDMDNLLRIISVREREACAPVEVTLEIINGRNEEESIQVYFENVNIVSDMMFKPYSRQIVHIPVASCKDLKQREGEYVLKVEGFGEYDQRLVYLHSPQKEEIIEERVDLEQKESNKKPEKTERKEETSSQTIKKKEYVSPRKLFIPLLSITVCLMTYHFINKQLTRA